MAQDSIIERVADAFIVGSLETFNNDVLDGDYLVSWSTLQQIIDSVNDHNQIMIEAFVTVNTGAWQLITELMASPDEDAQAAWMHLVNAAFNAARRKLEA